MSDDFRVAEVCDWLRISQCGECGEYILFLSSTSAPAGPSVQRSGLSWMRGAFAERQLDCRFGRFLGIGQAGHPHPFRHSDSASARHLM
jgi:hypothetical protein